MVGVLRSKSIAGSLQSCMPKAVNTSTGGTSTEHAPTTDDGFGVPAYFLARPHPNRRQRRTGFKGAAITHGIGGNAGENIVNDWAYDLPTGHRGRPAILDRHPRN
jgi:hypothetical protein